jgi:hypothetical protein
MPGWRSPAAVRSAIRWLDQWNWGLLLGLLFSIAVWIGIYEGICWIIIKETGYGISH